MISRIYSRIGAERPQSVSLVGDPKIGKSSLMWYLAHPETRKQFLPDPENYIYFSIPVVDDGKLDFNSFSQKFWKVILSEISKYLDLEDKTPSYDLFKKIVERLTQNNRKIIVFFDDFHLATQNESFPLEFFSYLRSLANNYNLAFVTTSYLDLQKLCVSTEIAESPFFNIFTNLSIKPFEESEALRLIETPSKQQGVNLVEDKDRIVETARFFPYTLQLACHLLFDMRSNHQQLEQHYQEFEETFSKMAADYFEDLWQKFDEGQRFVIKEALSSRKIKNTHQFVLNDLVRRSYLTTNGEKVQFVLPHFQRYVAAKLGLKEKQGAAGGNGWFSFVKKWLMLGR